MNFLYRLAGIPCIIEVTSFERVRGEGYMSDSTIDSASGYCAEYEVCDRRGRPAPWLERKINDDIDSEIMEMIGELA